MHYLPQQCTKLEALYHHCNRTISAEGGAGLEQAH